MRARRALKATYDVVEQSIFTIARNRLARLYTEHRVLAATTRRAVAGMQRSGLPRESRP